MRDNKALTEHPVSGISNHLHICLVHRDRIEIGTNDQRWIGEPENTHFVMPPVANSMKELEALLFKAGLSSAAVSC